MYDKEKIESLIEELKLIVRDLHRSAGQLDRTIEDLEIVDFAEWGDMEIKMEILLDLKRRLDVKKVKGYDTLNERENAIIENIFDQFKKH